MAQYRVLARKRKFFAFIAVIPVLIVGLGITSGVKVTAMNGVDCFQPGFVAGQYGLFHDGDSVTFEGFGIVKERWEYEFWISDGVGNPPARQGSFIKLPYTDGEGTGEKALQLTDGTVIGKHNNLYYLVLGKMTVTNKEGREAAYNIALTKDVGGWNFPIAPNACRIGG